MDVRTTERDKVKMEELFRPGDVIRAEVISLGDAQAFYLSTAKVELGVLSALAPPAAGTSAADLMVPISWEEMICPKTLQRAKRKVAKPI